MVLSSVFLVGTYRLAALSLCCPEHLYFRVTLERMFPNLTVNTVKTPT